MVVIKPRHWILIRYSWRESLRGVQGRHCHKRPSTSGPTQFAVNRILFLYECHKSDRFVTAVYVKLLYATSSSFLLLFHRPPPLPLPHQPTFSCFLLGVFSPFRILFFISFFHPPHLCLVSICMSPCSAFFISDILP